jgi:Arc/MetJ-type ribon-helix-helix transcriptional regulator
MISSSFPQDISSFIAQQLAEGKYRTEEELMVEAVRVLREVESHQRQFADDVRLGMDQLERGEFNEYDEDGLRDRFEELKDRARLRIAARGENA